MNPIRLLRFQSGKTLTEVSTGTGVAISTLRRFESGRVPNAPQAKALADFYGVPVEAVLGVPEAPAAEAEGTAV